MVLEGFFFWEKHDSVTPRCDNFFPLSLGRRRFYPSVTKRILPLSAAYLIRKTSGNGGMWLRGLITLSFFSGTAANVRAEEGFGLRS